MIRKLEILSPCPKDFASMPERGRERYCDSCDKNVVDLSQHTEEEVQSLIARGTRACVRILRDRRTGHIVLAAAAAAAVAACSSAALDTTPLPGQHVQVQTTPPAPDAGPVFVEELGQMVLDEPPETPKR